jgi:hypothetical protein
MTPRALALTLSGGLSLLIAGGFIAHVHGDPEQPPLRMAPQPPEPSQPPSSSPVKPPDDGPADDPRRFLDVERWNVQIGAVVAGEKSEPRGQGMTCGVKTSHITIGNAVLETKMNMEGFAREWEGDYLGYTTIDEDWKCASLGSTSATMHGAGQPTRAKVRLSYNIERNEFEWNLVGAGNIPTSGTTSVVTPSFSKTDQSTGKGASALDFVRKEKAPRKGMELTADNKKTKDYQVWVGPGAVGPFEATETHRAVADPCPPKKCSALPDYIDELWQQKYTRNVFKRFAHPPPWDTCPECGARDCIDCTSSAQRVHASVNDMDHIAIQGLQDHAKTSGTDAFNKARRGPAQAGKGLAKMVAALGTDANTDDCGLEEPVFDKNGARALDKDGNGKWRPLKSEKKWLSDNCSEISSYVLVHEHQHVQDCKKLWAQSKKDKEKTYSTLGDRKAQASTLQPIEMWNQCGFFSWLDYRAYGAGIDALTAEMTALARRCGKSEAEIEAMLKETEAGQDPNPNACPL